jgi:formamidase
MPKTLFKVDLTKPMDQQELPGHNRWHPDIPAVASVNPGEVFRIESSAALFGLTVLNPAIFLS